MIWVNHAFSSIGYQLYKKHCHCGSDDADSEAVSLEGGGAKVKDFALENSAFDSDENGCKEKNKDISKDTQLWDHQGAFSGWKS